MSEDDAKTPPASRIPFAVRKAGYVLVAILAAWLIFGKAIPALLFSHLPQPVSQRQLLDEALKERDEKIEALNSRVDTLEGRIKTLESTPKPANTVAAPAAPVDDGRVTRLETVLHQQNDEISALKTQLGTLQMGGKQEVVGLAAFGILKDSIARGEPFAGPLTTLAQLTSDNAKLQPLLTALQPFSASGAPTLPSLQKQFATMLPVALGNDNNSLIEHMLHSLIRIRKVGEQQAGNSDEAILARAEAKLAQGDIDAALHDMQGLSPAAAATMRPWMEHAQGLLHIRAALNEVQLALVQDAPAAVTTTPAGK